jgi:hypothetical protein
LSGLALLIGLVGVAGPAALPTPAATDPMIATSAVTATTAAASAKVRLGVFRGTSPAAVKQFGLWLGRKATYASDFSARATWYDIANPDWMLNAWKGSGYRMVYAIALLPTADPSATMAQGADGAYDQYYATLAKNLVAAGQGNAILRLGWEFNIRDAHWHPDTPEHFIAYWRHVVTAMRAVPGAEHLAFDWNPNIGGDTYDATRFYPGNDYVSSIGVDTYDISWAKGTYPFPATCNAACKLRHRKAAWLNTLNGTFGLKFWATFARSQGKPMSLPEWGLWKRPDGHGGGDNPYFIQQMYKFIDNPANNVAYTAYFDVNTGSSGTHTFASLPAGGAEFRRLFGRR